MRCEKCQSELPPGAHFCSACGHPVAAQATLPLSPDSVICPACGTRQPSDERFCSECGQALQSASPQAQIPPATPTSAAGTKRRRWPYVLGASLGIAVLGGLGFMEYQSYLERNEDPFAYYLPEEDTPEERFLAAARAGNPAAIKAFLAEGIDPNLRNGPDKMTALMIASTFGETEAVQALIAGGADVNARMDADWTALKWAAHGGHVNTVRALIAGGADVNAKGPTGHTALVSARASEHMEVVRILQEAGAKE